MCSSRSGDRIHQFHRRLRRPQSYRQLWPFVHRAEAEEDSRQRGGRDRAPAPEGAAGSRHAGLLPAHPEPQYRRPHLQEPVPVRDAERRYRIAVPAGAGNARQDREDPGPARRHHRSLHQEPADDGRYRPREGRGLRHHRRSGPQPALQRLRRAAGRHHLHAVERLPDHSGGAAAVPRRSVRPFQALCEDGQRPDHSAGCGRQDGAHGRPAADQPSGPAAGRDDLVQPRAGLFAGLRRRQDHRSSSRDPICRRRS